MSGHRSRIYRSLFVLVCAVWGGVDLTWADYHVVDVPDGGTDQAAGPSGRGLFRRFRCSERSPISDAARGTQGVVARVLQIDPASMVQDVLVYLERVERESSRGPVSPS
ncbi:MAG: hypothetical protein MRJ92_01865 [Nitrospira sp.]|nr:hypothetical protein [Nitrospira sp.]